MHGVFMKKFLTSISIITTSLLIICWSKTLIHSSTTATIKATEVPENIWIKSTNTIDFIGRWNFGNLVYKNKIWVIGGENHSGEIINDIWNSNNGIAWTEMKNTVRFSGRSGFGCFVYNNKMWVIGDGIKGNDVWNSNDGFTWTQITSTAGFKGRSSFGSLVFNNKMWVIGGASRDGMMNDIWNSSDGITWMQVTSTAGFSCRRDFGSFVYNNKMWVIGGEYNNIVKLNDVWNSSDGITWTQVTVTAGFSGRQGFGNFVYNNKMWVIGGMKCNPNPKHQKNLTMQLREDYLCLNDVWNSSDGVAWTQVTGTAGFSGRYEFGCTVFNNKIWVIKGGDWYGEEGLNDIWNSSDGITWTRLKGIKVSTSQ
jgi:hypothetical protein